VVGAAEAEQLSNCALAQSAALAGATRADRI
jgi:hypothetical protein